MASHLCLMSWGKKEPMNEKDFEKSARTLLRYGIGKNIEEAREHLRALLKKGKGEVVRSWVSAE